MARAAVLGRLTWRVATVVAVAGETATARTIALEVPGWPGHLAGQHVDVRLTAPDGYSAQRSYSIASAPGGSRLELTVQRLAGGEVSPYLTETLAAGDPLELRGPGRRAVPPGVLGPRPASALYADELERRRGAGEVQVAYAYTRGVPPGWPEPPGRIGAGVLAAEGWLPEQAPAVFVCGPTGFVEAVSGLLVDGGHDPHSIKTERFGPTGG